MTDKKNRLWLVSVLLMGGCLVFGSVPASAASTSKNRPTTTAVSSFKIAVSVGDIAHPVNYFYIAKVKGEGKRRKGETKPQFRKRLKKCRKGRIVVFFHDENGNGKYDRGEYKIGVAKSDKEGRAKFKSGSRTQGGVIPPESDKVGVWVKRGNGCRGKQLSRRTGPLLYAPAWANS